MAQFLAGAGVGALAICTVVLAIISLIGFLGAFISFVSSDMAWPAMSDGDRMKDGFTGLGVGFLAASVGAAAVIGFLPCWKSAFSQAASILPGLVGACLAAGAVILGGWRAAEAANLV